MRIARGLRDAIAQIVFGVTPVKDRIRRLMTRLGARRRAELAAQAMRLGVA